MFPVLSYFYLFPLRPPVPWLSCLILPGRRRGELPGPGLGRLACGTDRETADIWSPLSSLLRFQDLLARGSGGAVGCGGLRANSRTAEQSELPTNRRYVPVRPAPPTWLSSGRLMGEGAGR